MMGLVFLESVVKRILKRPVAVDRRVSVGVIMEKALSILGGLARGTILYRRGLVLGHGVRISDMRKLHIGGGLVRIEDYSRLECTSHEGIHLGRNFKLGSFSRMIASGTLSDLGVGIRVGDNVGIGEYSYIGGAGGVVIGSDTIVGQYFSVHPENHIYSDPSQPIRKQGVTRNGVVIGDGCWIGAKVTIVDGVTIGRNCVIAAGSVVTKSFPDNSVIGGVPAKLLRARLCEENDLYA